MAGGHHLRFDACLYQYGGELEIYCGYGLENHVFQSASACLKWNDRSWLPTPAAKLQGSVCAGRGDGVKMVSK